MCARADGDLLSQTTSSRNIRYESLSEFNKKWSRKSAETTGELLGWQLKQIRGCSASVATVLVQRFGTLSNLLNEMERLGHRSALVGLSLQILTSYEIASQPLSFFILYVGRAVQFKEAREINSKVRTKTSVNDMEIIWCRCSIAFS